MSSSYELFSRGLQNKEKKTNETYTRRFNDFLARQKVKSDALTKLEPRAFEDLVYSYIDEKSKAGAKHSFLNQAVSAVRFFCLQNRINLNFPWLYAQIPKPTEADEQEDQPYTQAQIDAMIKTAGKDNLRPQVSIAIMAKGGARIGALPTMRIEPDYFQLVEKYNVLAIQAYPKTRSAYWVLLPPKASALILKYKAKRTKGQLFISKHEGADEIKDGALISEIWRLAVKAKVRKVNKDRRQRHKNMLDHAFRKHHSTTLERAGLRDDHVARLRGNKKGLKGIYQLPTPLEIIELTGFMGACPMLEPEQLSS